jgi:hypothetical protein
MKQRLQSLGRPLALALTITLLGLTAVFPILNPALPCSDDAAFHLFRLVQLDSLLQDGVLYCRWAPDMAQGYGTPFFNFYAPLSYYVSALISAVVGNLNLGLRLTFALAIVGGGWAAYLLTRDYFSRTAALVAAVAYMYAPYQGYDVYFRGNLAESAAWPLLPLALWAMGRLIREGGGKWLAVTAVVYAAILLTHNVFALIFSPLLGLFALVLVYRERIAYYVLRKKDELRTTHYILATFIKPFLLPLAALLLGLGLATFFWLPAMLERELVHSDRLLVPPVFVYWNNFVTLGELFALPRLPEPNLLNPSPPRTIGLITFLLALPGFLYYSLRNTQYATRNTAVRFFGLALFIYLFMMTAVSEPIWDLLPLIEFVQFPWRLLGPAAVCVAFLVAATIDLLPVGRWRLTGGGLAIALLILTALFWFHPRYCPGLDQPTVADMQAFERDSHTIGTTARGEYLPRPVVEMPRQPAEQPFPTDNPVLTILTQERRGVTYRASIVAGQPTTVTVNSFAYPGWRAEVNGTAVSITPSPTHGLITFPVPAGSHELTVTFGETPLRRAANWVSILSLLVTLGLLVIPGKFDAVAQTCTEQRRSRRRETDNRLPITDNRLPFTVYGLLALLLFGLSQSSLLALDGRPTAESTVTFHNGMRLLDSQMETAEIAADESLLLRFAWDVLATPDRIYQTNVLLVDETGLLWSLEGTARPRIFRGPPPTNQWPVGHYATDWQLLDPLPGTPPGSYQVRLSVFEQGTERLVGVVGGGPDLPLGQISVTRPNAPTDPQTVEMQYTAVTNWEALQLLGYNLDRNTAVPGDPFLLTLFWQNQIVSNLDWQVRLDLYDESGQPVFSRQLPPVTAEFPTSQWQSGDLWRGQHLLRLPAGLASGPHTWQLQLCQPHDDGCTPPGQPLTLGQLSINAPERSFTPPELTHPVNQQLGDVATLLGAILTEDGGLTTEMSSPSVHRLPSSVTLVWQSERETAVSYRVFLHLIGPDGALITQSDGEPAQWSRPTTGWLPGEIIRDSHQLTLPDDLPPGQYTLLTGLYDPLTGERLPAAGGETAVTIATYTLD